MLNRPPPLWVAAATAIAALLFVPITAHAATLKPETVTAWTDYVRTAKARSEARLHASRPFLLLDEDQSVSDAIRSGEVFVAPVGQTPRKVPEGLIHDWVGSAFLPNTTVAEVLATLRDYDHYTSFYGPTVIKSKTLTRGNAKDRFSMVIANNSLIAKTALDSEYETSYVRVDNHRYYSVSEATRIQEIERYGTAEQHVLPVGEGTGFIWKLLSMTRFEERDGGVYVELEVIALSRDVPRALRWAITPIVRRVSKDSVLTSLRQTSTAVHSRDTAPIEASNVPFNTVSSFHR